MPPKDDPTEQEIREACQRIQDGWTEQERERRRWNAPGVVNAPRKQPLTVQVVDTSLFTGDGVKSVQ